MVKQHKKDSRKRRGGKGSCEHRARARRINAFTEFETCSEHLSPFGGLLKLIKPFDLVGLRAPRSPAKKPPNSAPISKTIYPVASGRCCCKPTASFCPGRPSRRPLKLALISSSPTEAAPRYLTTLFQIWLIHDNYVQNSGIKTMISTTI